MKSPYLKDPLYIFLWLRPKHFREYGIMQIHTDQVISVTHSTTGEAEDRGEKNAHHVSCWSPCASGKHMH